MQITFKTGKATMAAMYIIIFSNKIFEIVSALLGLTIFIFISKLFWLYRQAFVSGKACHLL